MTNDTVLLVDDNDKLRALFRLSLESFSPLRVVGEARTGREGIEAASSLRPGIVLLDLSMPTMDGLEAMGAIRRASPESHVVILTGFKADRLEEIAKQLGATAFIEKGIPPTRLAETVRKATAGPPPPYQEIGEERVRAIAERARELL